MSVIRARYQQVRIKSRLPEDQDYQDWCKLYQGCGTLALIFFAYALCGLRMVGVRKALGNEYKGAPSWPVPHKKRGRKKKTDGEVSVHRMYFNRHLHAELIDVWNYVSSRSKSKVMIALWRAGLAQKADPLQAYIKTNANQKIAEPVAEYDRIRAADDHADNLENDMEAIMNMFNEANKKD